MKMTPNSKFNWNLFWAIYEYYFKEEEASTIELHYCWVVRIYTVMLLLLLFDHCHTSRYNTVQRVLGLSSLHFEDPVITVLFYKLHKVDTTGINQIIVGCACHSTGCLHDSHYTHIITLDRYLYIGSITFLTNACRVTDNTSCHDV